MSHSTVKLNFNQSCEIKIDNQLSIEQMHKDKSYNQQLEKELEERNLDIIENIPIKYSPETDSVHDLKAITYQVSYEPGQSHTLREMLKKINHDCISAGLFISKENSLNDQIMKRTKEIVDESTKELKQEIEQLKSLIFISNSQSIYPSLIREMIRTLKIDAIKTEFGIDLSRNSNQYFNMDGEPNEKFTEDFKNYSKKMFDKYKDQIKSENANNRYFCKLFTYNLNKLNNFMHPVLEGRCAELERAVKDHINCEFDEAPLHPLVTFLKKWKQLNGIEQ